LVAAILAAKLLNGGFDCFLIDIAHGIVIVFFAAGDCQQGSEGQT
jgi:hypothetical protein